MFLVPLARADADPPSDILLSRDMYVPIFGGKASDAAANELEDTVIAAKKAGYYIKVAVIGSRSDLGGAPQLWKNPKRYAPFLGRELTFVYQSRLLVAMPAGYGFYWRGHQTQAEQRLLDRRSVSADADGLVRSTAGAVRALSAAAGYPIAKQGGSSNGAPPPGWWSRAWRSWSCWWVRRSSCAAAGLLRDALTYSTALTTGNSELRGVLPEREWILRAPTLQRKLALTAKVQDEVGHAQLIYRVVEDLGKPRAHSSAGSWSCG